ncbi:GNAT family N-acetyltransferase [Xylocopilactobacillus apicola]|uniref:Ribosomal-protein-L7/L12-serine acetyltransferase n=1 Tax=Xylocopilactobacillus apicola TaxID=2932184 RepID=A0AAU9D0A9_9LACO|nr:GNAT family protein [Xylocopilactobacillus apicola]BDR58131.1 ribosomal-protein-L7/L12-serine acetyltransferase [Xylocopilactobacillus apicola]
MDSAIELFEIFVQEDLFLRLATPSDAPALFKVLAENRAYLAQNLPWVNNYSEADLKAFLTEAQAAFYRGAIFEYLIVKSHKIIGIVELNDVNANERSGEIGYWLAEKFTGHGIATQSVKALVAVLSRAAGVHRFVIRTDPNNLASQQVAKNAGFIYEGIRREDHFTLNKFSDSAVYYYLAQNKNQP